ncbi:c-type cytochrome [Seonamhaeicola algicola]|nr:cytochrome c [Seonamhaeicola algicola]
MMKNYYLLAVACLSFTFAQAQNNLKQSIENGKEIYNDFCITCHMAKGEGVKDTYPPLAKSDYLMNNRKAGIRAIKFGISGEIIVNGKTYNNTMATIGLSDDEIADVMNYITNTWGNKNDKIFTKTEVENTQNVN